ncbi:DEAD/DEAH box helicase [Azospirillum brasilense]|uniref:DEAD/DEAH box helicase n=1 Tax=Azospirillum brasilense TaxID=192 RepID=UPI000E0CAC60|nr:DEAD/DEAH box helicase family protein [Azospirillum brasilense]
MDLKTYQRETLGALREFLEQARLEGPKAAYDAMVRRPELAGRLGRYGDQYRPLEGLPQVPYVCLRLPTGGGKTILAAHGVETVKDAWTEKDYPVVLWLVPSNTIRRQTVEALKNPRHPYRQALDKPFGDRVRVFDIADFEQIPAHDLGTQLCVVVGTIQTLRVQNTEGRRVYANNENLEPHFAKVPHGTPGLERLPDGKPKHSFANLLHVHRPLMIVDEAHNAVTGLTRDMQQRVNPCAIIEFTATPRLGSNTLYSVTAQELKGEEMIKLPVVLSEHKTWQGAVSDAIARRATLDTAAKGEREYIRPIVLFQAQPKNQEVTVDVLRQHLIDVENIPEQRIAVATGDQRDLDGIDLFDRSCPIEFIITVEALKEGWDCSFAYVFCSVANIRSAVDVEQLLGRVLRMPYARRRRAAVLNRAYAHVTATAFAEAANALCERMVNMGFDEEEAKENIEPQRELDYGDEGLFGYRPPPVPSFSHTIAADPAVIDALTGAATHGVRVTAAPDGAATVVVSGALSAAAEQAIATALPENLRRGFREAAAQYRMDVHGRLSPAQRGERFVVPALVAEVQGSFLFADSDLFLESVEWSPLDHPARLDADEFNLRETAASFEIDLDGKRVVMQIAGESEQLPLGIDVEGWTEEGLVLWLDRQTRHPEVSQGDLIRWLSELVHDLVKGRGMPVAALMRAKFILARKIREKIAGFRSEARAGAYQRFLFDPQARVEVSFDDAFAFAFKEGMYDDQRFYRGRMKFRRHFLGPDKVPAFDGVAGGEEERCAIAIDGIDDIAFWIRNVRQHRNSFRLPTSSDNFYPDFVARLKDGRTLVIEYKGKQGSSTDDTREKRAVGLLWEQRSKGEGLFLVVEEKVEGMDMRTQIIRKITSSPAR